MDRMDIKIVYYDQYFFSETYLSQVLRTLPTRCHSSNFLKN